MKSLRQNARDLVAARPALRWVLPSLAKFRDACRLHAKSFGHVAGVILPQLVRTGKRPVLFSRYVGLGDVICTFPAALELKKRHPGAAFIYSCHPDSACLPKMGGITELVAPFRSDYLRKYWGFLFAASYHFEYGDDRSFYVSSDILIEAFCRQFGVSGDGEHPRLRVPPAVRDRVRALLAKKNAGTGPVLLLHPGPSWPIREWPRSHWSDLAEKLAAQGYEHNIELGSGQHPHTGKTEWPALPATLSLVNQLTLEESIALIEISDLLIGIDSGLLHVAASLRKPAIGLFGPTTPRLRFSPRSSCSFVVSEVECQGCHHRIPCIHWITNCPYDIRCMKNIPVQTVLQASLAKLAEKSKTI
ncbi:MAG TPA: glycosyltransferase family 9 protein [Verrucomicrobiae bacterium]|nr:glycosyltransferase family 9 protein [Verrucomicrobiae bacterium]